MIHLFYQLYYPDVKSDLTGQTTKTLFNQTGAVVVQPGDG
jgi:hypothetical protein